MAQVISEEEFQKEASEFLEANASPRVAVNSGWGEGSDEVAILEEKDRASRRGGRGILFRSREVAT